MESPKIDWRTRWFEVQQEPLAWLITAERLKRAAEVLYASQDAAERVGEDGIPTDVEDMQFHLEKPAMLLLAFAMENAIKAYLLDSGQILWADMQKPQKELPQAIREKQKIWKSHNFPQLFDLAAVSQTDEQKTLLASLSSFAKWAGRYPLDFDRKKCFAPSFLFDEGGKKIEFKDEPPEEFPPTACHSVDYEKLKKLFDSVVAKVKR